MIKLNDKWYVGRIQFAHLDGDGVVAGLNGIENPKADPLFLVDILDPDNSEIQSVHNDFVRNSTKQWFILTDGEKCWYLCDQDLDPMDAGMSSLGTYTINYSFYPAISDDRYKGRIREQIKHFVEEQTGV